MKKLYDNITGVITAAGFLLGVIMLILNRGFIVASHHTNYWVSAGEIIALLLFGYSYVKNCFASYAKGTLENRFAFIFPFLPALLILFAFAADFIQIVNVLWLFELYLVVVIVFHIARFSLARASNTEHPTNALLVSFIAIILAGAGLLMLPGMHRADISFTDAMFTSTSAVCVTGLAVCDTATDFTTSGQWVIFSLIQVGGLGIMIFGALFAMLLGSRLSMKESVAMRDILNEHNFGDISRKVMFICISTFAIELVGMFLLFSMTDSTKGMYSRWFFSLFHSVSAFCNAGFSLQSDSLVGFGRCWQVYLVICPLIIIGGLGFPVLLNLFEIVRYKFTSLYTDAPKLRPPRLSLHSRLVLVTTIVLLIGGTILLWCCGLANNCSNNENLSLLDCFFNSVTVRTAGFNTVNISELNAAGKLVMIGLMCIGGSPASTAGGIKTVAVAIMFLTILSSIKNQTTVDVHYRTVSVAMVRRSLVLVAIYTMLLWVVTLLLIITENSSGANSLDLAFEAASALGTVGLSAGVTSELTTGGRWVIIFSMLAGRLGPLSLLTALTISPRHGRFSYPHEPLIIG